MINNYGFSIVGKSHIERNVCCQDSHCIQRLENGWCVAAIADGVGSASNAEIGSHIAAENAVEFCCKYMPYDYNAEGIKATIRTAYSYAYKCILEEAQKAGQPIESYDTTLSLAVYDGYHLIYGHSGDGAIIGLRKFGGFTEITTPQKGEDAVSVLPLRAGSNIWKISEFDEELSSVLLVTDGMRDTLCPSLLRQDKNYSGIYAPLGLFFAVSCKDDWEEEKAEIEAFLQGKDEYDEALFYERLSEIYKKFIPDESEEVIVEIRQGRAPVGLMYHEQDDKTVVALINPENEPFLSEKSFFVEPDWKKLKDDLNRKLYPHLNRNEEGDLQAQQETPEEYSEPKQYDNESDIFIGTEKATERIAPQDDEDNEIDESEASIWDRLFRKNRRDRV